jgi:acylphosphatase
MTDRVAHVLIRGRVQGVGFRAWVHHHAELNGLTGWVRNRRDGSVEAVFAGPESELEAMMRACRQGPAGAIVSSVDMLPDAERPEGRGFEVLPTR